MRAACSQLAIFEAEVGRLTETQASAQEEWRSKESYLQEQLNQATAQKVDCRFTPAIVRQLIMIYSKQLYAYYIFKFGHVNTSLILFQTSLNL